MPRHRTAYAWLGSMVKMHDSQDGQRMVGPVRGRQEGSQISRPVSKLLTATVGSCKRFGHQRFLLRALPTEHAFGDAHMHLVAGLAPTGAATQVPWIGSVVRWSVRASGPLRE